ncbi:MAG: ABC transporter ATP-binding protein [Acidimicrobiales bacterium]
MPTSPDDRPAVAIRDAGDRVPSGERRPPYLSAVGVTSGYNKVPVVRNIDLAVGLGEIVLIIGPNGAGKSTVVKALTGKLPLLSGRIVLDGEDISGTKEDERAVRGIGYVPQSGDVFPTLSVQENLEMGGYRVPRRAVRKHVDTVIEQFPTLGPLRRRQARTLSGGERKTLGIARALVAEPKLLVLDEPTSNLSPIIAATVLHGVIDALAASGRAVLLIEQRVALGLEVASWGYVLSGGRTRLDASGDALRSYDDLGSLFLEPAGGGADIPAVFRR